jgi:hypothetical protein
MNKSYNDIKLKEMAEEIAASFVKNYKCSLADATKFFYSSIIKNDEVARLISDSVNPRQLSKNATLKNFIKKNKKELYYRLRQYKNNEESKEGLEVALKAARENPTGEARAELLDKLAAYHVSSRERVEQNQLFYEKLGEIAGTAVTTVIDVGCGVQPLFFPHDRFETVKKYIAIDKDKKSISLLQEFRDIFNDAYSWLYPRVWNINEGWSGIRTEYGVDVFDLALVLKVVPVVERIQAELLEGLANIPAKTIVISGVKESMVKKRDIGNRERRSITNFINATERTITGEFDLENEFFIIVQ